MMSQRTNNLKWNTEVINGTAGLYDIELIKHTEYHYSLYHQNKGRFDYWPSTSKGMWIKNGKQGHSFKIENIEEFIEEHFNPDNNR